MSFGQPIPPDSFPENAERHVDAAVGTLEFLQFQRLTRRAQFLAVARGWRIHSPFFTLQANARQANARQANAGQGSVQQGDARAVKQTGEPGVVLRNEASLQDQPRFGLTVTKKTAQSSVHRNRIRRRMREALRLGAARSASPAHDYVFVARAEALTAPFQSLKTAMSAALAKPQKQRQKNRQSQP